MKKAGESRYNVCRRHEPASPPPPEASVDETPLELEAEANLVSEELGLAPEEEAPVAEPVVDENSL